MAQIDLSVSAQETSNWEATIDELLTLKSIYCEDGECEIISPTNLSFESLSHNEPGQSTTLGGRSVTIRVLVYVPVEHLAKSTHRLCLKTVFHLGSGYPQDAPTATGITCEPPLPVHVTDNILERLNIFITGLQPEPCLFESLEWLKDDVLNLVSNDPTLLPSSPSASKDKNLCTEAPCSDTVDTAMVVQTEKHDFTSESVCVERVPPGGLPTTHVCITILDHMRNEQKYLKLLNSWAKELNVYGKILHCGLHSIYAVVTGSNAASVCEFLKRWRTQSIDVDSQGRPCKEKLLRVLCREQMSGFACSWQRQTGRYACTWLPVWQS